MGQISIPFLSHDSSTTFIRNLWNADVCFCEVRRSSSPVANAGRPQAASDARSVVHAAWPQQDCPLFACDLIRFCATCDVACGRCFEARSRQIAGGMTTEGRWASLRTKMVGGSVCELVSAGFPGSPFVFGSCSARWPSWHCGCGWRLPGVRKMGRPLHSWWRNMVAEHGGGAHPLHSW